MRDADREICMGLDLVGVTTAVRGPLTGTRFLAVVIAFVGKACLPKDATSDLGDASAIGDFPPMIAIFDALILVSAS